MVRSSLVLLDLFSCLGVCTYLGCRTFGLPVVSTIAKQLSGKTSLASRGDYSHKDQIEDCFDTNIIK